MVGFHMWSSIYLITIAGTLYYVYNNPKDDPPPNVKYD